jgi:hypothetical protein
LCHFLGQTNSVNQLPSLKFGSNFELCREY